MLHNTIRKFSTYRALCFPRRRQDPETLCAKKIDFYGKRPKYDRAKEFKAALKASRIEECEEGLYATHDKPGVDALTDHFCKAAEIDCQISNTQERETSEFCYKSIDKNQTLSNSEKESLKEARLRQDARKTQLAIQEAKQKMEEIERKAEKEKKKIEERTRAANEEADLKMKTALKERQETIESSRKERDEALDNAIKERDEMIREKQKRRMLGSTDDHD